MDILEHRIIKGRKSHQCSLCGLEIKAGEEHRLQVLVDAGEFSRHRIHLECLEMTRVWKWGWYDWELYTDCSEFRERMADYKEAQKGMK